MVMAKKRRKIRVLDVCCCAGIGGDGYRELGMEVVGIDNDPKALAHHPDADCTADALEVLKDHHFLDRFDFVHASFPCQLFSATRKLADAQGKGVGKGIDLLTPGLALLREWGGPFIVENVERSPLRDEPGVVRLCGSSFGLKVQRHRLFVAGGGLEVVGSECDHRGAFDVDPVSGKPRPWGVYYVMGDNIPSGGRTCATLEHAMECMGVTREVPWEYLREGIPPAYTRYLGEQIARQLR